MLIPSVPILPNKRLIHGHTPVPAGYLTNLLVNSSYDDSSTSAIPLLAPLKLFGITYNSFYVGSNAYLTFNGASNAYSSLSPGNPGIAIHFGSGDRSFQRVSYENIPARQAVRVLYEGTGDTGGTVGQSTVRICFTFFPNNIIQADFGQAVTWPNGNWAISDGQRWRLNYSNSIQLNNSSITFFATDANGQNWDMRPGMIVDAL